ncbi:hypothetical protein TREMEDRAFT_72779 [Tremella mesenterica DSM 1558]|uniref:uncharacterized protein n=1 Tax=Tremella mesenterica (strain ATCC 24925 / CBS 8224 / DSM 1558 / NBRC 9311 / NRRL Y-6157 / RJB 2259-6 / UBC 559-6) TaxID=578456 RepID=UPI0003F49AEA|nr:uncharacterized protein TREMEDRAFT_72779 [Tremella mesenterica DSM 1558]EIW72490.1 hypothetical protein TREMEDRAFT_72779 [Tremella mesenterica DSM 1558]
MDNQVVGQEQVSLQPKVLTRNSACHQCRKRKLKCDAIRPVCSNCQKPRVRGVPASITEKVSCTWDEPKEPSARTRRRREQRRFSAQDSGEEESGQDLSAAAKRTRIEELEQRIVKSQINPLPRPTENAPSIPQEPASKVPDTPSTAFRPWEKSYDILKDYPAFTARYSQTVMSLPQSAARMEDFGGPGLHAGAHASSSTATEPRGSKEMDPFSLPIPDAIPNPLIDQMHLNNLSGFMSEMTWPDWPKSLPTLEVVEHVVNVFFERVPTLPKMIHKATFLPTLQLPPSHSNFPSLGLLHAILAVTAFHIPMTELASRAYFPVGTPAGQTIHPVFDMRPDSVSRYMNTGAMHYNDGAPGEDGNPMSRFQLWHRRKTFEMFTHHFDHAEKFLQGMQGHLIASAVDAFNAWWVDLWLIAASNVRMAIPMRLHESPVMAPAKSALEQAERDRTWWQIYLFEMNVVASTSWPLAIHEVDITVELPVAQDTFDRGIGELTGTQSLQSPDLFSNHPPGHLDSFCLLIKAVKLFSDVNAFFRSYCRGSHSVLKFVTDSRVRLLLSQLNAFRLSLPVQMRRPTVREPFDGELIACIFYLHGAVITLGEPLVAKETWTHELGRLSLAAIRAILSMVYDLNATSYDITLLPMCCSYIWCMCCRCLGRFMDAAVRSGDMVSASVFRSEIDVFRLTLARYGERYPVGLRHKALVDLSITESDKLGVVPLDFMSCDVGYLFDFDFQPGSTHGGDSCSKSTPKSTTSSDRPSSSTYSKAWNMDGTSASGSGSVPISGMSTSTDPTSGSGYSSGLEMGSGGGMGGTKTSTIPNLNNQKDSIPSYLSTGTSAWTFDPTAGGEGNEAIGWDISSFSFDPESLGQFFSSELMFDGSDFGLPRI